MRRSDLMGCMNAIKLEFGYKNPVIERKHLIIKGDLTGWII